MARRSGPGGTERGSALTGACFTQAPSDCYVFNSELLNEPGGMMVKTLETCWQEGPEATL